MADPFSARIDGEIDASLKAAWDGFVEFDPATTFRGKGPLPSVTGVSAQSGPWDVVGQTRRVTLSDGGVLSEEVIEAEAPRNGVASFAYRVRGYSGPVGALTDEAISRIELVGDDASTHASWRYGFTPKSVVAGLPMRLIVSLIWRSYVSEAFEKIRNSIEETARP